MKKIFKILLIVAIVCIILWIINLIYMNYVRKACMGSEHFSCEQNKSIECLIFGSCINITPTPNSDESKHQELSLENLPEDLRLCNIDSNCVKVSSKSCYTCPFTSINKKYLVGWNNIEKESNCSNDISWPLCISPEYDKRVPVCEENYCQLK